MSEINKFKKFNKLCKFKNACIYKEKCMYFHPPSNVNNSNTSNIASNIASEKAEKRQIDLVEPDLSGLLNNMKKLKIEDELKKTRLCVFYKIGCTNGDKCTYAHSKEELQPRFCIYKTFCKDTKCTNYHPGDKIPSPDELFAEALKTTKIIQPVEKKEQEKFIISLDSDSEEDEEDEEQKEKEQKETPQPTTRLKIEVDISSNHMIDLLTFLNKNKIKIISLNSDFHN